MKKNQFFELSRATGSYYLEKKLHQIAKGGHAIQNVLYCLNAAQARGQREEGEDHNYLDNVELGALDDAINILGEFIREESNSLCERFGLLREY